MIQWMTCTTCSKVVEANMTGICIGCQSGFNPVPQRDPYLQDYEEQERYKDDIVPIKGRLSCL